MFSLKLTEDLSLLLVEDIILTGKYYIKKLYSRTSMLCVLGKVIKLGPSKVAFRQTYDLWVMLALKT